MQSQIKRTKGTLYIIATPIGNLEDISIRALNTLKEVDIIAAEDTRHTKKLLNHFGIHTPLISYYREKEEQRSDEIINRLQDGQNVGLVSDAGTPAISDPGAVVVLRAHQNNITVVPLPGASALTSAISSSGLSDSGFLFLGFLPAKKGQRRKALTALIDCEYPIVLYESPRRVMNLLEDALEILGQRHAFWARELTKKFEDLKNDTLEGLLETCQGKTIRGESVIIISPGEREEVTGQTIEELIIWYRDNSELSLKDVSKKLSSDLGISRSQVYQLALTLWTSNK